MLFLQSIARRYGAGSPEKLGIARRMQKLARNMILFIGVVLGRDRAVPKWPDPRHALLHRQPRQPRRGCAPGRDC